jgi:hypothetical protein
MLLPSLRRRYRTNTDPSIQEVILSMIYIVETIKLLRSAFQPKTNQIMRQLVLINVVIILMDFVLLGFEYASLFILETVLKGFIYSVKLKLELAILGRLVALVGRDAPSTSEQTGRERSMAFVEARQTSRSNRVVIEDIPVSDFVDLTKVDTDYAHASPTSPTRSRRHPSTRNDDFFIDV